MMDRFLASVSAGTLVFMIALDAGLPVWRHLPIGDASDLGAAAAFAVWYCLKASAMSAGTAATTKIGAGLQPASAVGATSAETPNPSSSPAAGR